MSFFRFKSLFLCGASTVLIAGTAAATCSPGQTCRVTLSENKADIVPFALPENTSISTVSSRTVPGLGPNERLCPTTCPVDVYNPEGGEVLGCYDVCKPIAKVSTPAPQPQIHHQAQTQHVVKYEPYVVQPTVIRVVRPVIYVRYPVPVPLPHPACAQVIYGPQFSC